jgi:hypothetical protein
MITKVVQNKQYQKQQIEQIRDQLMLLVDIVDGFSLTANIDAITFEPELPQEITDSFSKFTLFSFANYTFESIILTDTYISFEAGFGEENIDSVVKIPYIAIFQIIVDESILFINPSATMVIKKIDDLDQEERSRNAFTMHGRNKNLLD